MDKFFYKFLHDFLSINPMPNEKQVKQLLFSIGLNSQAQNELIDSVKSLTKQIVNKPEKTKAMLAAKLKATTRVEKILQDEYNPLLTPADYLRVNDGVAAEPANPGWITELSVDGDEDIESIEQEQDQLANDGTYRI